MTDIKFVEIVKQAIADYFNERKDATDKNGDITPADVFIVWQCKALQNWKALASTTVCDGMYYEVTFNGDKNEIYLDAYKKWENRRIEL